MKQSLLSRLWLGLLVVIMPACTLTAPGTESGPLTISGAPIVEIISPAPNNTYFEGVGVNIQVSVSNAGADIARVEFSVDDAVFGTSESPNTSGAAIFSVNQRWTAEGVGEHTASVTAFRADGSSSIPVTVAFNVIQQAAEETEEPTRQTTNSTSGGATSGGTTSGGAQATQQSASSPTPAPTTAVPATEVPAATATPSGPQLTTNIGINVRSGPSTLFNPPLGGLAAGETLEILAVSTGRDWYKIRYFSADGWVFSSNVTTSGDLSNLPVEQGPPLPTAVPATAVPVATTPPTGGITGGSCVGSVAGGSNLCVSAIAINGGGQPFCGTPTTVVVTVGNNGSAATGTGFFVTATVTKTSDNAQVFINTQSTSAIIPAGGTTQVTVGGAPFTHMTGGGQTYRVTITFNPNGNTDANTADSTFATTYVLGGSC